MMGEGAQMDPLEQRIGRMARERLAKARIGIAGAGGLGSNIAMMLARSGVGHLVIADFDTVDESNLNRQHYAREHVGASKVDALSQQIHAVDPRVEMQAFRLRVTPQNARELFGGCDIVCEAFDDAQAKAMLVEQLLSLTPGPIVVSGNGMAGIGPASEIVTRGWGAACTCAEMGSPMSMQVRCCMLRASCCAPLSRRSSLCASCWARNSADSFQRAQRCVLHISLYG